jgi:aspartate racemase
MSTLSRPDTVGVLGGMGPLATVDYLRKVIELTPAEGDADHVPVIVCSCPQIPDRVAPIVGKGGPSPLPALIERVRLLVDAGARCLTMPCNTAHHWYDAMKAAAQVPFLHIADTVLDDLRRRGIPPGPVGLVGTLGTYQAGFYQARLGAAGYRCVLPSDAIMNETVLPGIKAVKKFRMAEAERLFRRAVERFLVEAQVTTAILACTELPAGLPADDAWVKAHCLDPNESLARATVAWALEQRRLAAE